MASHRAYYERWAKTWEFQALLKAHPGCFASPRFAQGKLRHVDMRQVIRLTKKRGFIDHNGQGGQS
jgi:glutamine synthetase adenylyltransferase